ncbi:CHAT domain-containing protein [Streptosporangiaceae bacterium NEAU-GS5]|nr:CHAT domain-containing protein [Streptosporangiaceae bacterium NEAU-GS5]
MQTAVEPLGLPIAALLVGARWVLAGTVDVNSTTTANLLIHFHRLPAAGHAPAAALQQVQLGHLRRRTKTTPAAWAGPSLIGDGFFRSLPI